METSSFSAILHRYYFLQFEMPPEKSYEQIYRESMENPEKFWGHIGKLVSWTKPWTKVLDNSTEPFTQWFVGGELNACYNAVDRHVEHGDGSHIAVIYDCPILGTSLKLTYLELQQRTMALSGVLASLGVAKGDRVLIYMPAIPETIVAMLATARLGAVHAMVFGGFAPNELKIRLESCTPKVMIAANFGLEPNRLIDYLDNVKKAIGLSEHKPVKTIVYQRKNIQVAKLDPKYFLDWEEETSKAVLYTKCVSIEANEPLYILYTSGTTGTPKGVQRPIGGHLAVLTWTMDVLYGMKKNDVWWASSDFGWVVGHSYMCYGPLLYGITTVIYEGKPTTTPDPSQYFRVISQYKVNGLFTVPTVLRIIKKEDPEGRCGLRYDISSLRHLFLAGEHCDLSSKMWAQRVFKVEVFNHWWQTETGHAITASFVGLDKKVSMKSLSTGLPLPGYQIFIMGEDGVVKKNPKKLGKIVIKLPLPPGTFTTLYGADDKFVDHYFKNYPGYYDTMDAGYLSDGLVFVTARDDDVINVSGHRLSTLAIEDIILSHPEVSEACVISVPDDIKSEVPFCFFVMTDDALLAEESLVKELIVLVKNKLGPVASFKLAAALRCLPQTRSGKLCRKAVSNLARNRDFHVTSTVVDPSVFDDIKEIFAKKGVYGKDHMAYL